MELKLYAAPLEGVSGCAWRKAHAAVFGGADKYYAPFISPTEHHCFTTRELRDITQGESNLVPQLLANNAGHFAWAAEELRDMGFSEVNFNLGCPSGTVVSKNKGAGLLGDLRRLDSLLDGIFSMTKGIDISVKTRIGMSDEHEWAEIFRLLEGYPISELIIHPRVRTQMYKGSADRRIFLETLERSNLPLVYNGDIVNTGDDALGYGVPLMIGRGLISRPALFRELKGGRKAGAEELEHFHELVLNNYSEYISGEVQLLHKMKEFWSYFRQNYNAPESVIRKVLKAKNMAEYRTAVHALQEYVV